MKRFIPQLGLLIVGISCGIALSMANATAWTPNGSTAPQNNTETLLHVGAANQEKGIGLPCSGAGSTCGLAVGSFLAAQNAAFDGDAYFHSTVTGKADAAKPATSTLSIGDATSIVSLLLSNNGYVTGGGLYSNKLVNNVSYAPVCADKNGNIILCSQSATPPPALQTVTAKMTSWCTDFYTKGSLFKAADWHAGVEHFQFEFDQPLSVPLTMQFATCEDNQYAGGNVLINTCQGTNGFAAPLPNGYQNPSNSGPVQLTIPAGTTKYQIPLGTGNNANSYTDPNGNKMWFTCANNGNKNSTKTSYTSYVYFRPISPAPNPATWQFSFSGTGYSANLNTSYGTAFPMHVTQIP